MGVEGKIWKKVRERPHGGADIYIESAVLDKLREGLGPGPLEYKIYPADTRSAALIGFRLKAKK